MKINLILRFCRHNIANVNDLLNYVTSYGACTAQSVASPLKIMFPSVNGTNSRTNYLSLFSYIIMRGNQGKTVCSHPGDI